MASVAISAALQRACSSRHVTNKQQSKFKGSSSMGTKQAAHVVNIDVEGQRNLNRTEQDKPVLQHIEKPEKGGHKSNNEFDTELLTASFFDNRWKNGTWDLNMFVKNGTMDWDSVIVAEARRRKFLELYPETSTKEEPVIFRSSIIPWWAWLVRSYLPEAELLNGRAAMVGFFTAYLVDVLTGLDEVGQTGNFICKAGLFVTVVGVVLFRRTQDFENLQKVVDEAATYDQQWQASWKDQSSNNGSVDQTKKENLVCFASVTFYFLLYFLDRCVT